MSKKATPEELEARLVEYKPLFKELRESNDRAFAILFAAFIEEKLAMVLRKFMIDGSPIVKELFRPDQPLGTFSAKAKLAYVLGLLTATEYQNMKIIMEIRNRFAHALHGLTFSDDSIANKCKSLKFDLNSDRIATFKPRSQFSFASEHLVSKLSGRAIEVTWERIRRVELPDNETSEQFMKRAFGR